MGLEPILHLWSEGWRQLRLWGWRWAAKEIPHTLGATHPAMREAVLAQARLERPRR